MNSTYKCKLPREKPRKNKVHFCVTYKRADGFRVEIFGQCKEHIAEEITIKAIEAMD